MTEIKIAGYLQGYLPKTAAKKTPEDEERRVQAALNVLHRTVYDAPSIETEYDAGGVSLEELEEVARAWKNSQLPEFRRERYPRRAGAYGEEDGVPISYEEILREYKDYYKKKQAMGKTAAKKTPGDEERRVQDALNVLHRAGYDAPSAEIYHDAGDASLEELEELALAWKNDQLPELRRERYPRRAGAYGEEDGVPISYEEILRDYNNGDYYINLDDDVTTNGKRAIGKTAAKKPTLKEMLGMGGDPPEGMTQEGWPLLPAVRPMYTEDEVVFGPEDDNVIYMPDGRTEWQGLLGEETPYATADAFYGEMDGVETAEHGLPEGYEYLATDVYGDPLLKDPEGNLVTLFHETGELRKVKTQLKIRPRDKKRAIGKTGKTGE